LIVYAIIKGLRRLLAIGLTILLASLMYLLFLAILSFYMPLEAALIVSGVLAFLAFTRLRRLFQALSAISIGVVFALVYPLFAVRFFSVLIALADLVVTLKGPMKEIVSRFISLPNEPADVLAMNLRDYSIGLGDLIVYASLPTSVMLNVSPIAGLFSRLMIPIGVYLSALWASKRGIVPALPIPVALMSFVIGLSLLRGF
jgi:hypothetical protein